MVFRDPRTLQDMLDRFIANRMKEIKGIDIYVVTGVNSDFTVNIKHLNFKKAIYNNVQVASQGLSNLRGGVMILPNEGDLVIVAFLGKSNQAYVIGTIFNTNGLYPAAIPTVAPNELFLNSVKKGSYIILKENNDILIRSCDSEGNKKALIKMDANGNVTIEADSVQIGNGTNGFARVGDTVEVSVPTHGTCTGTITSGSSKVNGGD